MQREREKEERLQVPILFTTDNELQQLQWLDWNMWEAMQNEDLNYRILSAICYVSLTRTFNLSNSVFSYMQQAYLLSF